MTAQWHTKGIGSLCTSRQPIEAIAISRRTGRAGRDRTRMSSNVCSGLLKFILQNDEHCRLKLKINDSQNEVPVVEE